MHGSWLRIARSHIEVSSASSRSAPATTTRVRSSSIAAWFCAVGGTITAAVISPSSSIS